MPKAKEVVKISREGTANFEFFRVSVVIPPEQRRIFRVNKGEFFRQLLERDSHKVNRMTVTTGSDQELNALLDNAPRDEPIPVSVYVYHCIASSGLIFQVSDYIVSDVRLLL